MFYTGSIYGKNRWIRPSQVYNMTNTQSKKITQKARIEWTELSLKAGTFKSINNPWYANNTRESIRDDVIRKSLVPVGAVRIKENVPTTSSKPRYALSEGFAALFDEKLVGTDLINKIEEWQGANLSTEALAKIQIVHKGAAQLVKNADVIVHLPNGETRKMAPGPSSVISKYVIEDFTRKFLKSPALLFLSESRRKVVESDDDLAKSIGLRIDAGKHLPDIILADLEPDPPLFIFVEVVATGGQVTEERKEALLQIALDAGFKKENIAFLTAFLDKNDPNIYKRLSANIAWGTLVWFASEPENLIILKSRKSVQISSLKDYLND